jgi:hypothetical protein
MDSEEFLGLRYKNCVVSDGIQRPHINLVYQVLVHCTCGTRQNVGRNQASPDKRAPETEF